tara:strand:- start:1815 stop:2063 length:249 start_codon:yes stop_codon:yes gene_type:complete
MSDCAPIVFNAEALSFKTLRTKDIAVLRVKRLQYIVAALIAFNSLAIRTEKTSVVSIVGRDPIYKTTRACRDGFFAFNAFFA